MKNWKKNLTIGLFIFCLSSGILFSVNAAETNPIYNEDNIEVGYSELYPDISTFRDAEGNHTAPKAQGEYVFAGWYSEPECGSESALSAEDINEMGDTKSAYAKFVSARMLDVKGQLKADVDSTLDTTTLRFVSTVDCLDYLEVGFTLDIGGVTTPVPIDTVYEKLYVVEGTTGNLSTISPTDFHNASKYFMACNLKGVPNAYFGQDIVGTPYWITCDGTRVDSENTAGTKSVNVGFSKVCEAKVTTDAEKELYYLTLEKAFSVADGDNTYLEDGYIVTIIQNAVEIEDTLTVHDDVTVTNEAERDVTVTRNMSNKVFVDNLSTGLTIAGSTTTVEEESKGSLTFIGSSDKKGCIDSDESNNVLTLNNITIKDFITNRDGGAIRTTGTANFADCVFENITQTGNNGGGVIYHISGNLTTTGCTFTGNKSTADTGSGAAIYVKAGTVKANDCDFNTNVASANGGAIYMAAGTVTLENGCSFNTNGSVGDGGAVYVAGGTLNENGSDFTTNKTSTGNGGAIYVATGTLIESDSTFTGNEATAGNGGAVCVETGTLTESSSTFTENKGKNGAAIRLEDTVTKATITGSTFDNNDTYTDAAYKGGALNIQGAEETITIQSATFKNNDAKGDGGAIYIANGTVDVKESCKFDTNTSAVGGGAIYVAAGTLTENGSTFTNNNANHGGAIRINSDVTTATITGSTFDDNNTKTGAAYNGGAINIVGATDKVTISDANFLNNDAANFGGAVYVTDGAVTVDTSCTFSTNGASTGGAIYVKAGTLTENASEFINNIAENGGAIYFAETITSATVTDSTFSNNNAKNGAEDSDNCGGAIYVGGDVDTEATYETETEKVTIDGATFEHNSADNIGGAVYIHQNRVAVKNDCQFTTNIASGASGGGAIYIRTGTSTIAGTSFRTNEGAKGGAIYVNNGTITVQDSSSFTSNEATTGGAIYVEKGKFIIKNNCTFSNNIAAGNGGAICVEAGTFSDTNSTYTGNTGYHGATIRLDSGITKATITDSEFNQNYTSDATAYNGGVLHINGATENVTVDGVTFANNSANGAGGAVCITAGTVYIQNSCEFTDNNALGTNGGGAVYVTGGTLNIENGCSFTSNEATKNGGAICVNKGTLNESGSTYKDNTANHGAGIRVNAEAAKVTIAGTTFDNNDTRTDSAYKGGALNIQGAAETITIEGTIFKNNDANSDGGAICIVDGVVEVKNSCQFNANTSAASGGAIYVTAGTFTENGSTYTQNSANHGGAIRINSNVTTATISGSTFDDNNTATGAAYNGGAINIVGATDKVTVSGAAFQNNDAANFGGAIYVADGTVAVQDDCSFTANGATSGGAIYTVAGTLTDNASTFTSNKANNGAALYVADTTTTATITGSTFDNNDTNTDTTYDGGAVYIAGSTDGVTFDGATFQNNDASNVGGAIYVYEGNMTVQNGCSFTSNIANGTNGGGAIYIRTGTSTIKNSSFNTNKTTQGQGGALYVNNGTVTIQDNSTFSGNTATGNGGAVYVKQGTFTDKGSTYSNNEGKHGGAIRIENGITSVELTETEFNGNTTVSSGNGAAINAQGAVTLNNCTFTSNTAVANGGAILANAKITDNGSTYESNSAVLGGAVYVNGSTLNVSGSTVQGNTASTGNGGAIYMAGGTVNVTENSTFDTNTAAQGQGGAVYVSVGTLNISDSVFNSNSSKHGGAIRMEATTTSAEIKNAAFTSNNTTAGDGGAINIQASANTIKIENVIFKENSSERHGGAIYTKATNLTVDLCTFDKNSVKSTGAAVLNDSGVALTLTNTTIIDQPIAGFKANGNGSITVTNSYNADDGYEMSLLTNMEESEYEAYSNNFLSAGYTLHSENEMNGNLFRTYATESGDMLHTYWVEHSKEVRTIAAETTALPVTSAATSETKYTPLLHQLKALDSDGADGGMGYIIRLTDGRFIIIDGGYDSTMAGNSNDIMNFLAENAPDSSNIVIATWLITHTHGDHSGAFKHFAENKDLLKLAASVSTGKIIGNITVESVMYNACDTAEQLANCAADTSQKAAVEATLTEYYPNAKVYKPLTGQVYTFADTSIEILYTMPDFLPNTIQAESDGNGGDYNIQSMVSIIDIDNTADKSDRFFVMGDTNLTASQEMSRRYGTYMESDYVQIAHHGLNRIEDGTSHNCRRNGPDKTTYDYIVKEGSTIALWPTSQAKFEERTSDLVEVNIHLVGIVKENVVAGNGAKTYEFQ